MIQIWTFPAAPSTERVPSLAERVAYLRYSINLRLFNWRVPALLNRLVFKQLLLCCDEDSDDAVMSGPEWDDSLMTIRH